MMFDVASCVFDLAAARIEFDKAIVWQTKALEAAPKALAEQYQQWLKLYQDRSRIVASEGPQTKLQKLFRNDGPHWSKMRASGTTPNNSCRTLPIIISCFGPT